MKFFDEVEPNPSVRTVDKAVEICRNLNADLIIGAGGGSPIDVAKAVGVIHANGGSIVQYEGIDTFSKPVTPLLAIPTTSGTGSEVTSFTVITDTERNYKLTVGGVRVAAKWAVVDPKLTVTAPAKNYGSDRYRRACPCGRIVYVACGLPLFGASRPGCDEAD